MNTKYHSIFGDITVTVIDRVDDTIIYLDENNQICNADIDWFMNNFKSQYC